MTEVDGAEVIDARSVRITFTNGKQRSYAFEPIESEPSKLASHFNDFMTQGYIVLEKDDSIIVIPVSSIQQLEIAPKPDQSLPNTVKILHEFGD
jgi:hypothetical protein